MDGLDYSYSGFGDGGGGEFDEMDLETFDDFDIEAAPKPSGEVKAAKAAKVSSESKKKEEKKKKSKEKKKIAEAEAKEAQALKAKEKQFEIKEVIQPPKKEETPPEKRTKIEPEPDKPVVQPPIDIFQKLTNDELEQVKIILETQVKLSDGSNAFVFSKTKANVLFPERSSYHCHVCDIEVTDGQRGLLIHTAGKKHVRLMGLPTHPAKNFRDSLKKVASQNGATGIIPIHLSTQQKPAKRSQFGKNRSLKVKEPSPVTDIEEEVKMVSKPPDPTHPEIEKAFHTVTKLQGALDTYSESPLIGLEYIVEVRPTETGKALYDYHCLMCNVMVNNHKQTFAHVVSYQHRETYLERHFPTVHARILTIPKTKEYRVPLGTFVQDIIRRIEQRYGRLRPLSIVKRVFESKRYELKKRLEESLHFRENEAFNFNDLPLPAPEVEPEPVNIGIPKDRARKNELGRGNKHGKPDLIDISDCESESDFVSKEKARRNGKKEMSPESQKRARLSRLLRSPPRRRSRSRSPSFDRIKRQRRPHSRSPHTTHKRSRSPSYKHSYRHRSPSPTKQFHSQKSRSGSHARHSGSRSPSRHSSRERHSVLDEHSYQKELKALENEVDRDRRYYEQFPEKHPRYPEEWKIFWNRRYSELKGQGKDPKGYNYKPEWIKVWDAKWHEIHAKEVSKKKFNLRVKYGLEKENVRAEEPKHFKEAASVSASEEHEAKSAEISNRKKLDKEANVKEVTVDDIKNTWKALTGADIKNPSQEPLKPVTVVSALRLMTALEEQLGSLGPRVNALLSQALSMEKISTGVSESLLAVGEHVVLIETALEKLRGQIASGLIEGRKQTVTEKVINEVSRLLENAPKLAPPTPILATALMGNPTPGFTATSQMSASGSVGEVADKVVIAEHIAKVLIENGRTDITEAELNQLVNTVLNGGASSAVSREAQLISGVPSAPWHKEISAVQTPPPVAKGQIFMGREMDSGRSTSLQMREMQALRLEDRRLQAPRPEEREIQAPRTDGRELLTQVNDREMQIPKHDEGEMGTSQSPDDLQELSMVDLQNLLQNFQTLSPHEQNMLINYVKKLEQTNPEKVKVASNFFTPKLSGKEPPSGESESFSSQTRSVHPAPVQSGEVMVPKEERTDITSKSEKPAFQSGSHNTGNVVDEPPSSLRNPSPVCQNTVPETASKLEHLTAKESAVVCPESVSNPKQVSPVNQNSAPSTAESRNLKMDVRTENKNVYEAILENARRQHNILNSRIPTNEEKDEAKPTFLSRVSASPRSTSTTRELPDMDDHRNSPDMVEVRSALTKPSSSQKPAITLNLKTPIASLKRSSLDQSPKITGFGSDPEVSPLSQIPWSAHNQSEVRKEEVNSMQSANQCIQEGRAISTLSERRVVPQKKMGAPYAPVQPPFPYYGYPQNNMLPMGYAPMGGIPPPSPHYPQYNNSTYPGAQYYGNR